MVAAGSAGGDSEEAVMNSDTGGNRGPRRAGLLAVVAAVAMLAAACSGSNSSSSSASGVSANLREAFAYTQCMRTHGEPNFPDPQANGDTFISPGSGVTLNSAQLPAAVNACQHLEPGGSMSAFTPPTEQNLLLGLRMAQCVRAHGVPNFPDPGGVSTGTQSLGKAEGQSTQAQNALTKCRSLLHVPPKGAP
jgi:hypothetical protein